MIILPDKNIPRAKFLLPMHKNEWRSSSQAKLKDQFGNEDCVKFRITARLDDGHIIWRGWFDDREDTDAFLNALVTNTLRTQPYLWRLCTPEWNLDIPSTAKYDFKTQAYLSTQTGILQKWDVPKDWPNIVWVPPLVTEGEYLCFTQSPTYLTSGTSDTVASNYDSSANTIECLGGGGSGGIGYRDSGSVRVACGGGGGGYGKYTNLALTSGTVDYSVGSGGTAPSSGSANGVSGNNGSDTWFNGTTYSGASVGGVKGNGGTWTTTSGTYAGGSGGGGKGTSSATGGTAGTVAGNATYRKASGAGGGAGPNGNGVNGQNTNTSSANDGSDGGAGNNGSGGAGGTGVSSGSSSTSANAGNGTTWSSSYGVGGGSGGVVPNVQTTVNGGVAGNYGGGSGGIYVHNEGWNAVGAAGAQGLIVITYTPLSAFLYNAPMMGL